MPMAGDPHPSHDLPLHDLPSSKDVDLLPNLHLPWKRRLPTCLAGLAVACGNFLREVS